MRVRAEIPLAPDVLAVLNRELAGKYFWRLGYSGYWQAGGRADLFRAFRTGLRLKPFDWRMWKTYAACRLRTVRRA